MDRFGNAITNLPAADFPAEAIASSRLTAHIGDLTVSLRECYAAAAPGEPLAVIGSSGLLELAVNRGDFAATFAVRRGTHVEASW